jgi:hypothetical protein
MNNCDVKRNSAPREWKQRLAMVLSSYAQLKSLFHFNLSYFLLVIHMECEDCFAKLEAFFAESLKVFTLISLVFKISCKTADMELAK